MKALLDAVENILQFVLPALLIAWADRPRKQSAGSL
jgi:hypothetical protein